MYMYTHELDPKKGHPSPYALDKRALLDADAGANTLPSAVFAGMCAHMSPASTPVGKLRLGVPAYSNANGIAPMPIFLLRGGADYDVSVDSDPTFGNAEAKNSTGYSSSSAASTTSVALAPVIAGLVATGAFELATTEFTGTPTTGQLLTSPDHAADSVNKGKLKAAASGSGVAANTILVGVTSDGVVTNDQPGGPSKLVFWPIFVVKGI